MLLNLETALHTYIAPTLIGIYDCLGHDRLRCCRTCGASLIVMVLRKAILYRDKIVLSVKCASVGGGEDVVYAIHQTEAHRHTSRLVRCLVLSYECLLPRSAGGNSCQDVGAQAKHA
jgi:hypothetical protein